MVSGQGQVKALEAAEASSQSALDANRLGYQVGVRINIDVLNSQSQLFQTKRDLAQARYNVLLGHLKLRQANGTLTPEDLARLNTLVGTAAGTAPPVTGAPVPPRSARRLSAHALSAPPAPAPLRRSCGPRRGGPARIAWPRRLPRGAAQRRRQAPAPRRIPSSSESTRSAAPASCASSAASLKLKVCGPITTGQPQAAASIRFCPPSGAKLPPSRATSASP